MHSVLKCSVFLVLMHVNLFFCCQEETISLRTKWKSAADIFTVLIPANIKYCTHFSPHSSKSISFNLLHRNFSPPFLSEPKCKIPPAGLQGKVGHDGPILTCCHIVLIAQRESSVSSVSRAAHCVPFSCTTGIGDPTAPWAEDHYVVWHHRACHTVQNPQQYRGVNWFLALQSNFRF